MLNQMIANILPYMPKKLIWIFSNRYIAGETIEDGLRVSKELNNQGIDVTIDLLGEFISNLEQARENKIRYIEIIERFTSENISGNFSLKPSMFGLLIDKQICYEYIRDIVLKAKEKNNFIRIDMEDSQCVDDELELFKKLHQEFPGHVGIVLQAYLRRTFDDLVFFSSIRNKDYTFNFRLCKGIYIEPPHIAYKDYQEIRDYYLKDLEFILENKMYAGIATHDKYLINHAIELLKKHKTPRDRYEFQMLYGVYSGITAFDRRTGTPYESVCPFRKRLV
ncbi:MAG: proline dehydrogenase family protein [Mangrovibacterium sp.]